LEQEWDYLSESKVLSDKRFSNVGSWENWTRIWNTEALEVIENLEAPAGPIYDFGCYPGILTRNLRRKYLHQRKVTGFDILECDTKNTVVCDVFSMPEEYDVPIAIAIDDIWLERKKELFPWIYERLFPGGIYMTPMKSRHHIVPEYVSDLQQLDSPVPWIYIGRKNV